MANFVRANPWLLVFAAVALTIWGSAVWAIIKSTKFRRKWLWVLVSLIGIQYGFDISPGTTIWIGVPLGAPFVLWYWQFGKPQI
jgi:hypothetical protein